VNDIVLLTPFVGQLHALQDAIKNNNALAKFKSSNDSDDDTCLPIRIGEYPEYTLLNYEYDIDESLI
jgi:hypothetical protein